MKELRRQFVEGGTYFFTVVTDRRRNLLCKQQTRQALRVAVERVRISHPFEIIAWVLLPDHLHCIWTLPPGNSNYSIRWNLIKRSVSYQLKSTFDTRLQRTSNQVRKRESGFWQHRFWEHTIRDEKDLIRHFDYIHYNPLRHGLVDSLVDWEWSTFHKYVRLGYYGDQRLPEDIDLFYE